MPTPTHCLRPKHESKTLWPPPTSNSFDLIRPQTPVPEPVTTAELWNTLTVPNDRTAPPCAHAPRGVTKQGQVRSRRR